MDPAQENDYNLLSLSSSFAEDIDGIDQSDVILRGAKSERKYIIYNIDREIEIGPPLFGEMAAR